MLCFRLFAISCQLAPVQRSSGIQVLEADSFKLQCMQTLTGGLLAMNMFWSCMHTAYCGFAQFFLFYRKYVCDRCFCPITVRFDVQVWSLWLSPSTGHRIKMLFCRKCMSSIPIMLSRIHFIPWICPFGKTSLNWIIMELNVCIGNSLFPW